MKDLYIINPKSQDEGSQACFKSFRAWLQDEGQRARSPKNSPKSLHHEAPTGLIIPRFQLFILNPKTLVALPKP